MEYQIGLRRTILLVGFSKKIISGYLIVLTERQQMTDGEFIGSALIAGIHGLADSENGGNLRLSQIRIDAVFLCFMPLF